MTKPKKKLDVVKQVLHVSPDQGAAALVVSLVKPGYIFEHMDRKGTRCVVTWRRA